MCLVPHDLATPTSPAWRMADHIMGGRLVERLRQLRSEQGMSFERIAQELGRENVAATGTTVNAWCDQLGIEKSSGTTAGAA